MHCRDSSQLTEITPANRQGSYRVGLSHSDAPPQHKGEPVKWERFWLEAEEVCRCNTIDPATWSPHSSLEDLHFEAGAASLHVPAWLMSYYPMSLTLSILVA